MIRALFILLFCVLTVSVSAQGVWTWIKGDSISFNSLDPSNGSRGQLRVAANSNNPSTYFLIGTIEWTDNDDNLWMFYQYNNGTDFNKDTTEVWKYNIASNTWTWMAGYDTFDIAGAFSDTIKSSFRASLKLDVGFNTNHIMRWADTLSNLWFMTQNMTTGDIFLSKFDIRTYRFELINYRHNNYRSIGTRFIPNSANFPGFISQCTYWVIGHNVYIYGGTNQSGCSSELWTYNMSSNIWTWLGGQLGSSLDNYRDKYIGKGISSISNWPGCRSRTTNNWIRNNKLYFFGGSGGVPGGYHGFNKVWEYNLNTNLWTFQHGDATDSTLYVDSGLYPSGYCIEDKNICPSGREVNGSIIPNTCDRVFWLFGGYEGSSYTSSELWIYRPDDNQWIWVDGKRNLSSSESYYYGVKGVPSVRNKPPPKPNFVFSSINGSLYRFGSSNIFGNSWNNEIWRYDPDYSCVNYNITDKFIDRGIDKYICSGDSTVVRVRKNYDSLRIAPMTNVTLRQTDSTTEIWLKPSINTSYKIIAYGYRCESYLDSLTVPIVLAPPAFGYDTVSICQGQSIHGKTTTGNYTIKIKNPLGCDSTLYLKLTVLKLPRTILDTTICEGNAVQGHTSSGTYIDTFLAGAMNGCDSIYMLKLTVVPERRLLIDTVLCRGSNIAGYTITGTYYDTFASPEGCYTYRVIKLVMNEPSSSAITKSICQGQSYGGHTTTGTFIDNFRNINGCDSIRTLTLTVNPSSGSTLDTSICLGSNIRGHSTSGTHRDTLTDRNGCDSICILRLTVRPARPIKPLRNMTICPGADTIIDAGLGHRSYLWSAGESTSQIRLATPQRYILQFVDSTGCQGRDSMILSLFNPPQVKLPDTLQNYKGEYFFLEPIISPPASAKSRFRWLPRGLFTCDTCRTVEFRPDTHLMASVLYTDERGCSAMARSQILVFGKWAIGYPSAFSPNGDGQNDNYAPNTTNIKSFTLEIYNRTGEKVYQYTPERPIWDGTFKGEPAPVSTYYYYSEVILLNKAIYLYKGVFHLMR